MDRFSTTLSTLPPLDLHSIRADSQRLRKAQACLDHLTSSGRWMHDAGVADVTTLETNDAVWKWRVPEAGECRLYDDLRTTEAARKLLAGHHIMIIGDLHARLHYAALVFLLNGTATPDDVAFGFPQHKGSCWNPDSARRGGYGFGGWDHIPKRSPCHLRWYGSNAGTLHNLTMRHPPGSKAWWGRGTSRDVMTLLLRDKVISTTYRSPPPVAASGIEGAIVTYVWKGVVRTSGSYKQQHARHLAQVAAKVGTPPTMILAAMGTYDSQWQTVGEVSGRLSGLFEGFALRWPASEPRAPLLVFSGSSSCASGKKYSVYMGKETRHNHFHNMPNASSLIPYARQAATNRSVLYIDTNGVQLTVPPLRSSPCHYDLPIGVMSEALVQITLGALASSVRG